MKTEQEIYDWMGQLIEEGKSREEVAQLLNLAGWHIAIEVRDDDVRIGIAPNK